MTLPAAPLATDPAANARSRAAVAAMEATYEPLNQARQRCTEASLVALRAVTLEYAPGASYVGCQWSDSGGLWVTEPLTAITDDTFTVLDEEDFNLDGWSEDAWAAASNLDTDCEWIWRGYAVERPGISRYVVVFDLDAIERIELTTPTAQETT